MTVNKASDWLIHNLGTVRYSTVQYSTVQYSTVQYSTVQYSTVQYSTVQYSTVQYSTVQYSTVQYSIFALFSLFLSSADNRFHSFDLVAGRRIVDKRHKVTQCLV